MNFSPNILEGIMFICFGVSWPFAIKTTLRNKTAKGINPMFLFLVFVGYLAGLSYKLIVHLDSVVWLYASNTLMVLVEIILYIKYEGFVKSLQRWFHVL